ncbi:MAG: hypothetical protein O3A51_08905, partial [Verrucomicrobia bacterium]|nr:hypothetical protein [Verrucomicrobiota bacterium]
MRFIPDPLGSRLDYHFDIQRLRVNFNNVNPLLDSWGSDQIRRGIEKSMNNPRKKRKVQALRIPAWVPLDTVIDLRLNTVEP